MKIFSQNRRCPSQVLFAFDEVMDERVCGIRWAVAYSTLSGCERLVNRTINRMGPGQWERAEKSFITSLDFGLTEPAAMEYLANLPMSQVRIANPEVLTENGLRPRNPYHPKLYLFEGLEDTGFVVGSANLTRSALVANTEVVAAGKEIPQNGSWQNAWTELIVNTVALTPQLLEDYRAIWRHPQRREVDPDPEGPEVDITPQQNPVFWDALSAGDLDPMSFDHFWVEAGSMSSGGSHNQLELPRGANRFFGFRHSNYGEEHVVIGYPPLTLRGQRWVDRPLTWHGNNRMERINLPTQAQGGFDYRHTAVLFRRHANGFQIDALPWNDDGAIAWRAASNALGKVYRLGARGQRICGLF